MARITDAIIGGKSYGAGATQPMTDLTLGGQHGWAPEYTEWVSNQGYVPKPLICKLLEAPKFMQLMPEPQKWVETLRALVELHPVKISGLNAGLTVEFDEHPVGGAGEMQQEVVDVKRERSKPTFEWIEKYGNPIQTFLHYWIQYGMMDPDTKFALIATLAGRNPNDDMLADWFTMSCAFFEPDPTHRRIVKSWICTNMMPSGTDTIEGERDLTTARSVKKISVEFSSIAQFGLGSNVYCQKLLDAINITNANPYLRPSFIQDIAADVKSTVKGYENNINTLAKSTVPGIR